MLLGSALGEGLFFCSFLFVGIRTALSEQRDFVPCDHEYRSLWGSKFYKSRGTAVDVPYFLSRYDPDPLRFYLTAVAPGTRDTPTAVLPEGVRRAEQPCPERKRREWAGDHVGLA
jgi:hypothetical protein